MAHVLKIEPRYDILTYQTPEEYKKSYYKIQEEEFIKKYNRRPVEKSEDSFEKIVGSFLKNQLYDININENGGETIAADLIYSSIDVKYSDTKYEIQIRPRSGHALKHGITVLNTPGTIDSDYNKEIGVILYNAGHEPFEIKKGARIAQAVICPIIKGDFEYVDNIDDSGRGGYGSTGVK